MATMRRTDESLLEQVGVGVPVALDLELLAGEGANHAGAGHVLLEHRVERCELLLARAEHRPEPADEDDQNENRRRYHERRDGGQLYVHPEQQHHGTDEHHHGRDHLHQPAAHEVAHLVDVGGHAGDELPGLRAVVVGEAQPLQLVEDLVAHLKRRAMARLGREVPPEEARHAAGDRHDNEPSGSGEDDLVVGFPDSLIDDAPQDLGTDEVSGGRRKNRQHAENGEQQVVAHELERAKERRGHARLQSGVGPGVSGG